MNDNTESSPENGAADEAKKADAPAAEKSQTTEAAKEPGEKGPLDLLADAKAEAQKNKEQWVRTAADFDNFRKRSRKEIDESRKAGKEELLKEFLPVFDNLERALASAQRAADVKPVVDGLSMIMKQYEGTLGRVGITKVATKGSQFDPGLHEAIQQVESDEPPGTIVAEVQPGYLQGERLIRAAMVVVATPRSKAPDSKRSASATNATGGGDDAPADAGGGGGGRDAPADATATDAPANAHTTASGGGDDAPKAPEEAGPEKKSEA